MKTLSWIELIELSKYSLQQRDRLGNLMKRDCPDEYKEFREAYDIGDDVPKYGKESTNRIIAKYIIWDRRHSDLANEIDLRMKSVKYK